MTGGGDAMRSPMSEVVPADSPSVAETGGALTGMLLQIWKWVTRNSRVVLARGASRRLKLAETLSLGEKRFVSIVQVDGEQFLIGGSAANIVLMAKLEQKPDLVGPSTFESVFARMGSGVVGSELDDKNSAGVTR